MKLPSGELSLHSKGYRITCGTYVGPDGKRRPKVFWLGNDKDRALLEAAKIRWFGWVAAAEGGWDQSNIARMKATDTLALVRSKYLEAELVRQRLAPHIPAPLVVQMPVIDPTPTMKTPAASTCGRHMFHTALDEFLKSIQLRNLSRSHTKTTSDSIKAIKHYQVDCPIADVDYLWLEQLTSLLKNRPLSRKKDSRSGKYMPIKPFTVRRLLTHLRTAIKWINRQHQSNRFGGWRAPFDWQELFSVKLRQLMVKPERDKAADGPEQLTFGEIQKLYGAAQTTRSKLHPIIFLFGLFTGLGQTELSTVCREEIDLANATFTHRRNKTSVKGIYWLPPELVAMLREQFQSNPVKPDELAFRTRQGLPLVTDGSDSVHQAWTDWRKQSGVHRHGLGFYSLRRFFGDFATRVGGDSVGDAALAHTAKSVRQKHYSGYRDFEKVKEVGQRLHAELTAAGMFSEEAEEVQDSSPMAGLHKLEPAVMSSPP